MIELHNCVHQGSFFLLHIAEGLSQIGLVYLGHFGGGAGSG